jgi:ribonuclease R
VKQAYSLVEELMIAANEAVGRRFQRAGRDAIWRIHATPDRDAVVRLCGWLESYGVEASPRELARPKGMSRLLRRLQGHRAARPLSYLVLRTLKQAAYGASNVGHFGLASKTYLHFTSPIRRYPDLHVHRLLKDVLRQEGGRAGRRVRVEQTDHGALTAVARESSHAERRSIEVEREVRSLYSASLMRDRIGDEEWATIHGITGFGFFAALDDPPVEGLVKAESLPGQLEFDPDRLRLFERGGRQVYSLGDRVKVQVADASLARRQVDLELVMERGSHMGDPNVSRRELESSGKGQPARRSRRRRSRGGEAGQSRRKETSEERGRRRRRRDTRPFPGGGGRKRQRRKR